MKNATFGNSTRAFSELREPILIIFGAKCSFTPLLYAYSGSMKLVDVATPVGAGTILVPAPTGVATFWTAKSRKKMAKK